MIKRIAVIGGTGINERGPGCLRCMRSARGMDYKEHMNPGRQLPAIYAVKNA